MVNYGTRGLYNQVCKEFGVKKNSLILSKMSFGIIGVSPPTLKIANGVQKINKVHMYNQTVSQELNMLTQKTICVLPTSC